MTFYRRAGGAAVLAAALLAAGCARGPKLVPVQGVLTHNGRPVPVVRVQFAPDPAKNPEALDAYGPTDADGKFTLATPGHGPGAVAGPYKVVLYASEGGAGKGVPARCAELAETPINVEVPAGGGEIKIEIQDHLKMPPKS